MSKKKQNKNKVQKQNSTVQKLSYVKVNYFPVFI